MNPYQSATGTVILVTAGLFAYAVGCYIGCEDAKRELERMERAYEDRLEHLYDSQLRLLDKLARRRNV
jgi:hypothetical protein